MTTKNNSKTNTTVTTASVAVPAGSLMDLLAGEIARQARAFAATEAKARAQAKEVVGVDTDLLTLQTMVAEAESLGLGEGFMVEFKAKAKQGRDLLIAADAAGQMARRLAATTTVEGLRAHIDRAKAKAEAEKEAQLKAKAKETAAKEALAKAQRIERILADLGELTPGQRVSIAAFLDSSDWNYVPNAQGRAKLMSAAARVAAERAKAAKALRAQAAEEKALAALAKAKAEAAAAPLTHKVSIKK